MRTTPLPAKPLLANPLLATLLTAVLTALLLPLAPAPAGALGNQVDDDYAGHEPQGACRSTAQPGTAELGRWLVRTYPGTGSSGSVRACSSGGQSEHKDGRAFDWSADVRNATQRRAARDFLARAFATDSRGVRHALARRMGIMYVIWDDKIWSSSRGFEPVDYVHANCRHLSSLAKCSRTLRHLDHVHISLSHAGGAAQTSWYRARNTRSLPVLLPGTRALDPERTAVTGIRVPASGATYRTPFQLKAGVRYRIVGTGLVRNGSGSAIGDPNCVWSGRAFTPAGRGALRDEPHGSTPSATVTSSTTALLIAGRVRWDAPTRCSTSHTYSATYTPSRTATITLRARDADGTANPGQAFMVYFAREDITASSLRARFASAPLAEPRPATASGPRAATLRDETLVLDTRRRWGTRTSRMLWKGARYRVRVHGTATDGGNQFDASCYRFRGMLRSTHTIDPRRPSADHFGVYVAGTRINLRPEGNRAATCTARNTHAYSAIFVAPASGRAKVQTWDPRSHSDNRGGFTVRLTRIPGRG